MINYHFKCTFKEINHYKIHSVNKKINEEQSDTCHEMEKEKRLKVSQVQKNKFHFTIKHF